MSKSSKRSTTLTEQELADVGQFVQEFYSIQDIQNKYNFTPYKPGELKPGYWVFYKYKESKKPVNIEDNLQDMEYVEKVKPAKIYTDRQSLLYVITYKINDGNYQKNPAKEVRYSNNKTKLLTPVYKIEKKTLTWNLGSAKEDGLESMVSKHNAEIDQKMVKHQRRRYKQGKSSTSNLSSASLAGNQQTGVGKNQSISSKSNQKAKSQDITQGGINSAITLGNAKTYPSLGPLFNVNASLEATQNPNTCFEKDTYIPDLNCEISIEVTPNTILFKPLLFLTYSNAEQMKPLCSAIEKDLTNGEPDRNLEKVLEDATRIEFYYDTSKTPQKKQKNDVQSSGGKTNQSKDVEDGSNVDEIPSGAFGVITVEKGDNCRFNQKALNTLEIQKRPPPTSPSSNNTSVSIFAQDTSSISLPKQDEVERIQIIVYKGELHMTIINATNNNDVNQNAISLQSLHTKNAKKKQQSVINDAHEGVKQGNNSNNKSISTVQNNQVQGNATEDNQQSVINDVNKNAISPQTVLNQKSSQRNSKKSQRAKGNSSTAVRNTEGDSDSELGPESEDNEYPFTI